MHNCREMYSYKALHEADAKKTDGVKHDNYGLNKIVSSTGTTRSWPEGCIADNIDKDPPEGQ